MSRYILSSYVGNWYTAVNPLLDEGSKWDMAGRREVVHVDISLAGSEPLLISSGELFAYSLVVVRC